MVGSPHHKHFCLLYLCLFAGVYRCACLTWGRRQEPPPTRSSKPNMGRRMSTLSGGASFLPKTKPNMSRKMFTLSGGASFVLKTGQLKLKGQSWARDNTAATMWPCFQVKKLLMYYYKHRGLNIFPFHYFSITLSRCHCREAKQNVACPALQSWNGHFEEPTIVNWKRHINC